MISKCVYCSHVRDGLFKKEHVVPRGLGKFLNENCEEMVLKSNVCDVCNNILGLCDGELCYAGPEAMFRRIAGTKGRPRKEKHNPFYRNPFSREPVRLYGRFSEGQFPQLFEVDPNTGYLRDCAQIVFNNPQTGKVEHIPLQKGMKKSDLVEGIKKRVGRTDLEFNVFYDAEQDKEWLKELLESDFEKMTKVREGGACFERINIKGIFTITQKHHQAVAKIAFNYLMHHRPCGITGYEEEFRALREFIRYGKGHPASFVRLLNKQVLCNADIGWQPSDYGHVVTCSVDKYVYSYVHLFTGGGFGHGTYVVYLGRSPYTLIKCHDCIGHWFRIISKPSDKHDMGEIAPLNIIEKVKPARLVKISRS